MSGLKEMLESLLKREVERLQRMELLNDDDLARIPALARAAEIVQGLRAADVSDERTAADLEALAKSR